MSDMQAFIRQKAREHVAETNEKIMWSLHAVKKLRTGAQPIHVVIAVDSDFDRIFIITTYKPSADRWESDWKTRK